jgi:hypothetical protein
MIHKCSGLGLEIELITVELAYETAFFNLLRIVRNMDPPPEKYSKLKTLLSCHFIAHDRRARNVSNR